MEGVPAQAIQYTSGEAILRQRRQRRADGQGTGSFTETQGEKQIEGHDIRLKYDDSCAWGHKCVCVCKAAFGRQPDSECNPVSHSFTLLFFFAGIWGPSGYTVKREREREIRVQQKEKDGPNLASSFVRS